MKRSDDNVKEKVKMIFSSGSEFRAKRLQHGISQTDAARLLGVHKYTLCRWELGQTNSHRLRYEGTLLIDSLERGLKIEQLPEITPRTIRGIIE